MFTADPGPALVVSELSDVRYGSARSRNVVEKHRTRGAAPSRRVGRAAWRPAPDFATSAACWLAAALPHHTATTTAVGAGGLRRFAEIAGIELLQIDEATTVRDFARELRWNRR